MQKDRKTIWPIFLVSFLFFAHFSIAMYINSTALERFVDAQYTSLFFVFGALGSLFFLFVLPKLLPKRGLVKTTLFIFLSLAVTLLVLGTTSYAAVFTTIFVLYTALTGTVWYCSDLFVAHYTEPTSVGKIRGTYLTIINTAIAIMPAIAGIAIARIGIGSVYIIAAILLLLAYAVIATTQKGFVDSVYEKESIAEAWDVIRTAPMLRRILSINFGLQFFYAWMTIFTPLYLATVLHFSWPAIGIAFSFMLLPFVLLQYKIGTLADIMGEKRLLIIGFAIVGISTIVFALLRDTQSILPYALVLFASRIGACMIEVLSESYFFKKVSVKEESVVSVFRMMRPLAYVIAPLAGWYIIAAASYTTLFLVLGALLLVGIPYARRLAN